MDVTYTVVDLVACESQGQAPAAIIERQPTEEWFVASDAIQPNKSMAWSRTAREEHVWIPLVPYLTHPVGASGEGLNLIFGFMFQLGFIAALSIGRPVKRMHLAFGHPVQDYVQGDEVLTRVHLGVAVILGD